ncbi:LamG-like jellyroll fold domain-containing protein [Streptomyces chartreusis]|uniref:LamG-like jellyroll fold domain-containing protein n=1 Tax=Streptomyces chartreusis TaxID=1969 RepID=UPI0035D8F25E
MFMTWRPDEHIRAQAPAGQTSTLAGRGGDTRGRRGGHGGRRRSGARRPERFLQFVVYPHAQDADPTSWSHAVPVGRWMHIALVNDGRRTVMYVNGSKIARNPAQPSTGIATLGKPFVIGATQFDEKFGQGSTAGSATPAS